MIAQIRPGILMLNIKLKLIKRSYLIIINYVKRDLWCYQNRSVNSNQFQLDDRPQHIQDQYNQHLSHSKYHPTFGKIFGSSSIFSAVNH